jgi:type IV pilus assembly protein PilW
MSRPVVLRDSAGFSLVELMVALVIGMLALMFATRVILTGEQNKQASLGGSDAMQNGMLALFSITSDANQAGFGLNHPLLLGCNTRFVDSSGYTMAPALRNGVTITPLAAAVIESNGAAPDRISLYSGSSFTGTGSLVISQFPGGGNTGIINVASIPYAFQLGDVIVAAPDVITSTSQCAISQITAAVTNPAGQQFLNIGGTGRFSAGNLFGVPFASNGAHLFNLGPATSLSFHTWSVNGGFLGMRATDLAGAAGVTPRTVIDNVVSLKAQYGFDTRTGTGFTPNAGLVIGRWSATMIDADGDGVVGDHDDYQHVAALRVAVVARGKNPEKPDSAGNCSATPVAPTVFSSASPLGVAAVPMAVTVTVAGDTIAWQCYRYRVFETIVPLRNAGWRPA